MNSFTKKLVLSCTGVIFASFVVVYFLFNAMVGNYIRSVAERELSAAVTTAIDMAHMVPIEMRTGTVAIEANVHDNHVSTWAMPPVSFGWHPYEIMPFHITATRGDMVYQVQQVHQGNIAGSVILPQDAFTIEQVQIAPSRNIATADQARNIFRVEEFVAIDDIVLYSIVNSSPNRPNEQRYDLVFATDEGFLTVYTSDIWSMLAHGQVNMSRERRAAFVDTNMIMINANNEIVSPALQTLSGSARTEVEFLVDHYIQNRQLLNTNGMTMVSGANNAYYMRVVSQPMLDSYGPLSILLYTDISSASEFQRSMNRILGFLLLISGMFSLVFSVTMSAKFKRSIGRLCNYADSIGRGNWSQKAGVFRDKEFNQLSKSMDNMSHKLQTYESNQKQFFQNVSHELRTPLMSIQGYAEGILEGVFCKDEAAAIILSEGRKMGDLVGELLYVSKVDSSMQTPETIDEIDVKNMLCECIERVKPIAHKNNKCIISDTPEQDITINADEDKFARAILNILSNAIRHAKSEVKVNCGVVGDELKIVIRDDGTGIEPADLPNIFERFYKGENGNHGLGLAISNDVIKNMGGAIIAKNLDFPETGARFEITVPLE